MWWKKAYEQLKSEGYKFHNTDYDNRNKVIKLDYEIKSRPKIKDIIQAIDNDLKEIVKKEKIDLIIPIPAKGEIIIDSLTGIFNPYVDILYTYKVTEPEIKGKNILIIEDCIKTGRTIKKYISNYADFKPNKIVIYSIVNNKATISQLIKKYGNNNSVVFYFWQNTDSLIFTNVWRTVLWPFIEYFGLPSIDTPSTYGIIKNQKQLVNLYRNIVVDKSSEASLIFPEVTKDSMVIKGSINYTKFLRLNSNTNPQGINHTKIFLRFFFLHYTKKYIVFIIFPDFSISDLEIENDICKQNGNFQLCLKKYYKMKKNVCQDCVEFNLSKIINNHIENMCSESNIKQFFSDNSEFLLKYYPLAYKKNDTE